MRDITKKIGAALLTLTMVFSISTVSPVKAEQTTETTTAVAETTTAAETTTTPTDAGTVTFTVEKFTIGQGFLIEPVQVKIKSNDTASSVFETVMKANGYNYNAQSSYGFYLQTIDNADTGVVNIPAEISAMPSYNSSYEYNGETYTTKYDAPSNVKNDGNKLANKALGEGSYNGMAGWMFEVNNQFANVGADQVKVKNGDVIRVQFSVYGYGADIGVDTSSYTKIPKVTLANKDALIKEIASVNTKLSYWMAYPNVKASYQSGMNTLVTYNVLQSAVDTAVSALTRAEKSPTYPGVKRATVKKVKNVKKYKAKISVKKMTGVVGYQYKYSKYKKFKTFKTKTTVKTSITTKKFKKKQRCYTKIRAYIKVNGVKAFGKWSKVKSVKIKK